MSSADKFAGIKSVKIGELVVGQNEGVLASVGVGSCVIILLYHPPTRIGGIAHIILPAKEYATNRSNPYRFPDEAVAELKRRMVQLGACGDEIWGKIVGGASLFSPPGRKSIGLLNVQATKNAFKKSGINLVGEDTLGSHGRSVYFDLSNGLVRVKTLGIGEKVI